MEGNYTDAHMKNAAGFKFSLGRPRRSSGDDFRFLGECASMTDAEPERADNGRERGD